MATSPTRLDKSVASLLSRLGVDPRSCHFLLAVSGGRDSMCLLDFFAQQMRDQTPLATLRLSVASVHHGVRGEDADSDLALVREVCGRWQIPFYSLYLDPKEWKGPGGFESRARAARYRELLHLRQQIGADYLCTAHHQQDQVETLLLRMLRGTGLFGLRGILPMREDRVLRPFLDIPYSTLLDYANSQGIPWREDSSNRSMRYARNRIRHVLLPELLRMDPFLDTRLVRLGQLAQHILERIQKLSLPVPRGSELHRLWLATHGTLFDSHKLAAFCTISEPEGQVGGPTTILDRPTGSISWGANMYLLAWQFRESPGQGEAPDPSSGVYWVNLDSLPGVPVLRTRLDGDLFAPPGLRSTHRKLKKFLQESRIARHERDGIPLLAFQSEVLWVGGYAVSGNYQVQSQTRTVLELRLTKCHRTTP